MKQIYTLLNLCHRYFLLHGRAYMRRTEKMKMLSKQVLKLGMTTKEILQIIEHSLSVNTVMPCAHT